MTIESPKNENTILVNERVQGENHPTTTATTTPQLSPISSSAASTSSPTLNTSSPREAQDVEGISLLRQIFPGESIEELKRVHEEHVRRAGELVQAQLPTSKLGRRIWKEFLQMEQNDCSVEVDKPRQPLQWRPMELPDTFLRLPPQTALRRFDEQSGCWEYEAVDDLERRVLFQQESHYLQLLGCSDERELFVRSQLFSRVLFRDPQIGLGLTLAKDRDLIRVHAVISSDGKRWEGKPPDDAKGPSVEAGIIPGDVLLGLNGISIHDADGDDLLRFAVSIIHQSSDPIVFHFYRIPPNTHFPATREHAADNSPRGGTNSTPSLLDSTLDHDDSTIRDSSMEYLDMTSASDIHPFTAALMSRGLIRNLVDQVSITRSLNQFTERARQWESTGSFRIDSVNFSLRPHFDPKDLPPPMVNVVLPFEHTHIKSLHSFAPSTPTLPFDSPLIPDNVFDYASASMPPSEDEKFRFLRYGGPPETPPKRFSYPGTRLRKRERNSKKIHDIHDSDIVIPLMGARKALSVRILNTFLEDHRTAYTIWVYDVQSGREWYAPIRYFQDFQDLRTTTAPLSPLIAQIPFPTTGWSVFAQREAAESTSAREGKCRQLEHFLRTLCALVYRGSLHPDVAEIAIHVQSFLGCEAGLGSESDLRLHSHVAMNDIVYGQNSESGHDEHQMSVRLLLKRSLQRYTYRLFLLETVEAIINQFVNLTRAKGPALRDIESLEAQGRTVLKERALAELEKIRGFLDQMQELVLEGCRSDFLSISNRRDFIAIRKFMEGEKGEAYFERLIREAVREQIEIEVYVPLRSVVSRLLVNGWRHDDMEVQFKMQELRKRPQTLFRIPMALTSPSNWQSVSNILSEGVGLSTLPCAKLRAIVDAARDVTRLYAKEHQSAEAAEGAHLGADDFLPIFIFSVVQAEMERPCALCVLLKTLCDRLSRIGEIGYYLASFEAAIMHIQEIDLTDDRDEMTSFMSIPLTDVSREE